MGLLEAVVLGIVQGLTEFLPISSTAHLRIVPAFAGWEDPGAAFTAITQLGTMAAVVLYFRRDLWNIARSFAVGLAHKDKRSEADYRMGVYIALGTIPIIVFGFLFRGPISNEARNLYLISGTLIILGLVLFAAEKKGRRSRQLDSLNMRDAVAIGLAQSAALIPGVSRSGATITAGLFLNFDRASAARYSFLLSVPAVVLSGLYGLRDVIGGHVSASATVVATIFAFAVGWLSIAGLMRFLAVRSTAVFVIYRVLLGVVVLVTLWAGLIE